MNFQKIVLTIAIVLFIIMLLFIGVMLYQSKYNKKYPPTISDCPDYWLDMTNTIGADASGNDSSGNTYGSCINVKKLGNSSCKKIMDFTGSEWEGSSGACKKYKWAKKCDLTWDGITNNSDICSSGSSSSSS